MASPKVYVTPVTAGLSPVNILSFGAITGVVNSIETTIDTYTTLGDETIGDIVVSGTSYARFNIYINTVLSFVIRSGPQRQANLSLSRPIQFVAGDIIDVKVIHYNLGWTDDFEATILGI
jgi:hypothetical protein